MLRPKGLLVSGTASSDCPLFRLCIVGELPWLFGTKAWTRIQFGADMPKACSSRMREIDV